MNVASALGMGEVKLKQANIENSRFDADMLLGYVLGLSRDRLYLERERELSCFEEESFANCLKRRSEHEPLQYILGHQEFMGLKFMVDKRVLIPRWDTEVLVECWLNLVKESSQRFPHPRVLDLCTGSGAVAIAAAYYCPAAAVTGTDISSGALEVAHYNAEKLNVQIEWRRGDFLQPAKGEQWDYILTNPPYVSNQEYEQTAPEIKYEPSGAFLGGLDGLDFYRCLAREVRSMLAPQGRVLMEIGSTQGSAVSCLFKEQGFETEIVLDLAGRDRVVVVR